MTNNNQGCLNDQNQSRSNNLGRPSTHRGNSYYIGNDSQEADTLENSIMHPWTEDDVAPHSSIVSQGTGTGHRYMRPRSMWTSH